MSAIRAAGQNPVLTFTYRSWAAQDRLFQKGRRGIPGEKIVTHARGGHSWHNVDRDGIPASLAVDVALLDRSGKALLADDDPAWLVAGALGEELGLTWGGRWRIRDMCHYQLDDRGGLTLERAMQGADPVTAWPNSRP